MAAPASPVMASLSAVTSAPVLRQETLAANERSASRARALMTELLGRGNPLTSTACLLVSELVTNAILHSRSNLPGGAVTVVVVDTRPGLRVEVSDEGSADSVPVLKADPIGTNGRGLLLVDALADAWGYRLIPGGTTVWFQLTP